MIVILQILLLCTLVMIFIQDIKERKVSLFLLLLGILFGGFLHFYAQNTMVFLSNIVMNLSFVVLIFLILWLYAKLKIKKSIFSVFGFGDLLFFILLGVSLPMLSFLVVFVASLIFSLAIFLLLKKSLTKDTVPLAGFQALFLSLVIISNEVMSSIDLYAL